MIITYSQTNYFTRTRSEEEESGSFFAKCGFDVLEIKLGNEWQYYPANLFNNFTRFGINFLPVMLSKPD